MSNMVFAANLPAIPLSLSSVLSEPVPSGKRPRHLCSPPNLRWDGQSWATFYLFTCAFFFGLFVALLVSWYVLPVVCLPPTFVFWNLSPNHLCLNLSLRNVAWPCLVGDMTHLISAFLLADSINHGAQGTRWDASAGNFFDFIPFSLISYNAKFKVFFSQARNVVFPWEVNVLESGQKWVCQKLNSAQSLDLTCCFQELWCCWKFEHMAWFTPAFAGDNLQRNVFKSVGGVSQFKMSIIVKLIVYRLISFNLGVQQNCKCPVDGFGTFAALIL